MDLTLNCLEHEEFVSNEYAMWRNFNPFATQVIGWL